jgi:hypothetical protein
MPVGDEASPVTLLFHLAQHLHRIGMSWRGKVEQGIGVYVGNLLYDGLIQPAHKPLVYMADEYFYLLPEGDIPLLVPDVVAGAVALAIGITDLVFGEVLPRVSKGLKGPIEAYLHSGPAKLPVVHDKSLPQVKGDSANNWQFIKLLFGVGNSVYLVQPEMGIPRT